MRYRLEEAFYDVAPAPVTTTPRLVCVGRLCEAKGQLLLIEAAGRLAAKGIRFELVLAGDGEMRGAVEGSTQKYGIGQFVRITGWISSSAVRAEIMGARVLVLASFAEVFRS